TLDGATLSVAFDSLDRAWQVTSPLGVATNTFDGSTSRLTSSQIPGRMSWSSGHEPLSADFALSSETNTALSTNALLSKFAFTRDAAHDQITAITQTDTANPTGKFFQMSYDPVGELVGRPQTASASPGAAIVHEAIFGYDD